MRKSRERKSREKLLALLLAIAAGLVVLATVSLLMGSALAARRQLPIDRARVEALLEKGQTDADWAVELHAEYERQTEASLRREGVKDRLALVLLAAAVVFVLSAKWLLGLQGHRSTMPLGRCGDRPLSLGRHGGRPLHSVAAAPAGLESAAARRASQARASPRDLTAGPRAGRGELRPDRRCPDRLPAADDIDLSFVDEIVAGEGRAKEAAIPILQAVQAHYGYLPDAALRRVRELSEISAAQLVGVATFYAQFRRTPVGKCLIKVCHGTACHVAGASRITDELRRQLQIAPGADTDPSRSFTVEQVACLGCCTLAPVVRIDGVTHGHLRSDTALEVLAHAAVAAGASPAVERECSGRSPSRPATSTAQPKTDGKSRRTTLADAADGTDVAAGEIRIGLGSCCLANGSGQVHEALQQALAKTGLKTVVKRVGCVGMCHQTPLIEVNVPGRSSARYARVQPAQVKAIIRRHFRPSRPARRLGNTLAGALDFLRSNALGEVNASQALELRDPPIAAFLGPQVHIATEHCGCLDPTDLDEYLRHDGFKGLQRCRDDLTPDKVIEQIRRSGLRGRGGAGFPTGEKWARVRHEAGERKYVICNGDEGDPGAFMDRMLMESYPYRIIEGVAIAALAVGATEGCFYIRREYSLAAERIRDALHECGRRGLLGTGGTEPGRYKPGMGAGRYISADTEPGRYINDVGGGGRGLRLRVVEGAGAFVCGEESALIASLEGRRGMPRLRPPYPAQRGLWGRPTLVGNVETYALVPWILRNGPEAFAELGTQTSKGTKVFALTGKINRGGLIEVPMGVTIRAIVQSIGGGVRDGRRLKAVQIGGPSGGCVPADPRRGSTGADTPVDYEALAGVGAMMGSGGLVVLDETDCMVDLARYFLAFTQEQSCGQCAPCRIGTRRLLDILERLCGGQGRRGELKELEHLAHMVSQGSLCGLGQTAPNPVLSTLRYFRDEYEAHLAGRCPAGRCKALIAYVVTDACSGCTLCAQYCPADAIEARPYETHEIDAQKCTRCDVCRVKCPEDAIRVV